MPIPTASGESLATGCGAPSRSAVSGAVFSELTRVTRSAPGSRAMRYSAWCASVTITRVMGCPFCTTACVITPPTTALPLVMAPGAPATSAPSMSMTRRRPPSATCAVNWGEPVVTTRTSAVPSAEEATLHVLHVERLVGERAARHRPGRQERAQ